MAHTRKTLRATGEIISTSRSSSHTGKAAFQKTTSSKHHNKPSHHNQQQQKNKAVASKAKQQTPQNTVQPPQQAAQKTQKTGQPNPHQQSPQKTAPHPRHPTTKTVPNHPLQTAVKTPRDRATKPETTRKRKKKRKCQNEGGGEPMLRDIRRLQQQPENILQKAPFTKLVRELMQEGDPNTRITSEALEAIQIDAEKFINDALQDSNLAAIHRGRLTVQPKDVEFVCKVVPQYDVLYHPKASMIVDKAYVNYENSRAMPGLPVTGYAEEEEISHKKRKRGHKRIGTRQLLKKKSASHRAALMEKKGLRDAKRTQQADENANHENDDGTAGGEDGHNSDSSVGNTVGRDDNAKDKHDDGNGSDAEKGHEHEPGDDDEGKIGE